MIRHSLRSSTLRRGFVSTFVVLAVMASLAVIGMLCTKALMAQRRHIEQTTIAAQLEMMIVAAAEWQEMGGQVPQEGTLRLLLSEEDAVDVCEVELTSQGSSLLGTASIKRGGKLKGTKEFSLGSGEGQ